MDNTIETTDWITRNRCDRCGAQAKAYAENVEELNSYLYFCGHHLQAHESDLYVQGWHIVKS